MSTAPAARSGPLLSILYFVGMLLVFIGERIIGAGKPGVVASALGSALVLGALVARAVRLKKAPDPTADRALLTLYVLGAAALFFYFLQSDLTYHLTGKTLQKRTPRFAAVVETLWPALWLLGSLPVVFVELALASMRKAPVMDRGRVKAAQLSGLGIGFALVFCFSVAWVASERNKKVDLSYFRVAKAGESSHKIVKALDKPVQVTLFFPPANEVREEVEAYFADLQRSSRFLEVSVYDHALAPAKAKELGVSGNGIIVIGRDKQREQIAIPLALEKARSQLRVLDQEVHKRLLTATRPPRIAYFAQGHEERTFDKLGDTDRRGTVATLKEMLTDAGFEPREMGLAQGLANDVPTDATVVLIIGPQKPFLDEEAAALNRYVEKKGRVLIALDPEAGVDHANLLTPLGLKFNPTTLANDRAYWRRSYQPTDRGNVATGSFGSHVSVTSLSKYGLRAPVVFLGAGALEKNEKGTVGIVNTIFTVHADANTWNDKNGNFEYDGSDGEVRNTYELAAAINVRNASAILPEEEGRVVVIADSDGLTDKVMANVGNQFLFADAMRWLAGEERIAGTVNNEEDVPITHTRKQDVAWFYSTVFVGPAAFLGIGFLVTRSRRRTRPRAGQGGAAPPPQEPKEEPKKEVTP